MINSLNLKKLKSNINISMYYNNMNSSEEKKQLESLKLLLKNEREKASPQQLKNLPSIMKKGGFFTEKFKKWNRKIIKEGKTFYYVDKTKFISKFGKENTIKYDKRYNKKVLTKKSKKDLEQNNIFSIFQSSSNSNYKNQVQERLINLKQGQELEIDLTKINFKTLLKIIYDNVPPQNRLISRSIDGFSWITLSQSNIMKLENLNELTTQENGSDMEFIFRAMKSNGNIIIKHIKKSDEKKYQKPAGEFFRYYNKTGFNLEKYDIYKEKQKSYKNNCLFIALKNSEKVEESKLNQIKTMFKNGLIPTCKLNEICKILDICISINRMINNAPKVNKYGDKSKQVIKIGLIEEHYILDEPTNITSYSLNHYEEIKDLQGFENIYKRDKTGKYIKSKERGISSLKVVRTLLKNKNLIEKIPIKDLMDTQFYSDEIESKNLDYNPVLYDKETNPSGNIKENMISTTNKSDYFRIFYDFETNTSEENHIPYLVCFKTQKINNSKKFFNGCFKGKECGKEFINWIRKLGHDKVQLIAHNQRYDFSFIFDYMSCLSPILKGNRLMGGSGRIYKWKKDLKNDDEEKFIDVSFQDSLNLISSPLRDFGKMFNLKQEKEVMPYDLYTSRNVSTMWIKKSKCLKYVKEDNKKQFLENCSKWNCLINDKINIIEYSKKYCEIDVEILQKGYDKFRENILKICELDIINYCSLPSLSNDYMIKEGAFSDCVALSGVPRAFIQKCVVGGRCMVQKNEKIKTDNILADYDGVSLYPSSMSRIKGYMRGLPQVLLSKDRKFLDEVDFYFVKVLCLNNPTINRDFPVLSSMTEEGIRDFSNDTQGKEFYLDKIALEDAENFQGLKFKIISGYVYNQGFNTRVNDIIRFLFNERLKQKKLGNPIEKIYKLLMNSSYGKCLLKPIDSDIEIVYKSKWNDFLDRNYNFIKEFTELKDCYIVKKIKAISNHFNNVSQGVYILSMSKRIMNEVITTGEDNNCKIYYTDTDSIHIDYDKVPVLETEFKKKYGRELTGKNLGQFHIDFDLDKSVGEIKSIKSIFLGKKCYMDILESKDKDGNIINGSHLRMKGIPNQSINYTCEKLNKTPYELYEDLYNNKKIKFDLLCGGDRCNFQFNKDMTISSMSEFTRELCF